MKKFLNKSLFKQSATRYKQKKEIQWNLFEADNVGPSQKCLFYRDIRFTEFPPENKYLAKI